MPSSPFVSSACAELHSAAWSCIDLLSDLHLHEGPSGERTVAALCQHLRKTPADAVLLLGDVFEVWVGDDAAIAGSFEARMADVLRECRAQVFFMAGNRDFLLGPAFAAQAGITLLGDPCCLPLPHASQPERWLLSHGDAWCLDDVDYQRFRAQVRSPQWQAALLAKPLPERQAIARAMRAASANKQADMASHADVDTATALQAMQASRTTVLLHGHTHRPAVHTLPEARQRIVLCDWEMDAATPRADFVRLQKQTKGWQRQRAVLQPDTLCFAWQDIAPA